MEVRNGTPWWIDQKEVIAVGVYAPGGTPICGVQIILRNGKHMTILTDSEATAHDLVKSFQSMLQRDSTRSYLQSGYSGDDS